MKLKPRTRRLHDHHGFTLVEMILVIAIMAIAAMIVVPQMANSQELTLQAAARMVVSDLMYAQNEAVTQQATRKVIFDVTNDTYRLTDGSGNALSSPWKGGSYVVNFKTDRSFSGVSLASANLGGQQEVAFDDLGSPSSGGTIDVTAAGFTYRITIAPFTGRITVAVVGGG